jgi:hypothetical protein
VICRGHPCDHSPVQALQCISRATQIGVFALIALLASVRPAAADLTAFLGLTPTPENRAVRGFAGGAGLLIVGFEFEYANTSEDDVDLLPGLRTYSGNVLLNTPGDLLGGFQLYATAGVGGYQEELRDETETNVAVNVGGGAKIRLIGPLRVRLDYRVFRLQGSPLHETYHRFYAGANLSF